MLHHPLFARVTALRAAQHSIYQFAAVRRNFADIIRYFYSVEFDTRRL
jgi:hypothetical protein